MDEATSKQICLLNFCMVLIVQISNLFMQMEMNFNIQTKYTPVLNICFMS